MCPREDPFPRVAIGGPAREDKDPGPWRGLPDLLDHAVLVHGADLIAAHVADADRRDAGVARLCRIRQNMKIRDRRREMVRQAVHEQPAPRPDDDTRGDLPFVSAILHGYTRCSGATDRSVAAKFGHPEKTNPLTHDHAVRRHTAWGSAGAEFASNAGFIVADTVRGDVVVAVSVRRIVVAEIVSDVAIPVVVAGIIVAVVVSGVFVAVVVPGVVVTVVGSNIAVTVVVPGIVVAV